MTPSWPYLLLYRTHDTDTYFPTPMGHRYIVPL